MTQQTAGNASGSVVQTWPRQRTRRDKSGRRWRVDYDLAYDGGGSAWRGFYRTAAGARIAVWWNLHVSSWGGTAALVDQHAIGSEAGS